MINIRIKRRVENVIIPGSWSNNFWQDLAGQKNTWREKRTEQRYYYDVILNGDVVYTAGHRPHAVEWIEDYEKTVSNLTTVREFERLLAEIRRLDKEHKALVTAYPWLYSHKLKVAEKYIGGSTNV